MSGIWHTRRQTEAARRPRPPPPLDAVPSCAEMPWRTFHDRSQPFSAWLLGSVILASCLPAARLFRCGDSTTNFSFRASCAFAHRGGRLMEALEKLRLLRRARMEDLLTGSEYEQHRARVLQPALQGIAPTQSQTPARASNEEGGTRHVGAELAHQHETRDVPGRPWRTLIAALVEVLEHNLHLHSNVSDLQKRAVPLAQRARSRQPHVAPVVDPKNLVKGRANNARPGAYARAHHAAVAAEHRRLARERAAAVARARAARNGLCDPCCDRRDTAQLPSADRNAGEAAQQLHRADEETTAPGAGHLAGTTTPMGIASKGRQRFTFNRCGRHQHTNEALPLLDPLDIPMQGLWIERSPAREYAGVRHDDSAHVRPSKAKDQGMRAQQQPVLEVEPVAIKHVSVNVRKGANLPGKNKCVQMGQHGHWRSVLAPYKQDERGSAKSGLPKQGGAPEAAAKQTRICINIQADIFA